MANRHADGLLDIADVVATEIRGGDVRMNIGDATTNAGVGASIPGFGVDGFIARPNDPDGDGAATVLYAQIGDQKVAIGTRDRRYADKVGELQSGDRAIVSKGSARFLLKNEKDRLVLYTETQSDGTSMMISASGESEEITLTVGLTGIKISADRIELFINGGPSFVLDKNTGAAITAPSINLDGGFVTIGLLPGGVRPVAPSVNSVLYGPLGQAGVASTTVLVAL
jgi:hypothetical protein